MQEQSISPAAVFDNPISVSISSRANKFLMVLSELAMIAAAIYLFSIESRRHLLPLFCFSIGGFVVHSWLPRNRRLPFFALLSVSSIVFLLGVANGLGVLLIGSLLIALCYLPIGFAARSAILVAAGAILVACRAYVSLPFWAAIGSMFMFRLVIFMHECRRTESMPPLSSSVAYFFLLSNANFPLFPVVDYRTFNETYYNDDEWTIYQKGITWITRGLLHLLMYRWIRAYLVPEYYQLYSIPSIALFMVTNYALYVQVSGQFHLVTGLLHLFGFNLPRTHNGYFLASNFNDIWRRINIYWKDFLTKFVFFPVFFALRRRGSSSGMAIVVSVFTVFLSTWLLHSWQTFWLLGRFPLTLNDAGLWIGVGLTVAVNSLLESHRKNRPQHSPLTTAFSLSIRTAGMFALVSLFWSCWTKPGFLSLIGGALNRPGAVQGLLLVLCCFVGVVAGGTIIALYGSRWAKLIQFNETAEFRTSSQMHLAFLILAVTFASPRMGELLTNDWARSIAVFRQDPTASNAAGEQLQSYYEDLNSASVQAGPLISSLSLDDDSRRAQAEGFQKISRAADLYQGVDLIPGIETELDGQPFTVNQFGMRDRRTVTFDKEPDTTRVAFIGSSVVMGYGVSDDDAFGRQFENRVNELKTPDSAQIEVLNFGVGRQWPLNRLVRIQRKVMAFNPDALFYVAHQDELKDIGNHVGQLVIHNCKLPSPYLDEVVSFAEIHSGMAAGEVIGRLGVYEVRLLSAIYRTIVEDCRQRSIVPVWVYVPVPDGKPEQPRDEFVEIASKAGFAVCDLSGWMGDQTDLFNSETEYHPNARGHRSITDALVRAILQHPELIPDFHVKESTP